MTGDEYFAPKPMKDNQEKRGNCKECSEYDELSNGLCHDCSPETIIKCIWCEDVIKRANAVKDYYCSIQCSEDILNFNIPQERTVSILKIEELYTKIEKLNYYGWAKHGMVENPKKIYFPDVFIERDKVLKSLKALIN